MCVLIPLANLMVGEHDHSPVGGGSHSHIDLDEDGCGLTLFPGPDHFPQQRTFHPSGGVVKLGPARVSAVRHVLVDAPEDLALQDVVEGVAGDSRGVQADAAAVVDKVGHQGVGGISRKIVQGLGGEGRLGDTRVDGSGQVLTGGKHTFGF